jgi:hypothetical protein
MNHGKNAGNAEGRALKSKFQIQKIERKGG